MRALTLMLLTCAAVACAPGDGAVPLIDVGGVVHLRSGPAGWGRLGGTGFLTEEGVLTAGHAIKRRGGLEVETWEGRRGRAHVVWSLTGASSPCVPSAHWGAPTGCRLRDRHDWHRDLGLVRVDTPMSLAPMSLARRVPRLGELVWSVGWPAGRRSVRCGAVADDSAAPGLLALDLSVGDGASGSPVIDRHGRVIAMVLKVRRDGLALAISSPTILRLLDARR